MLVLGDPDSADARQLSGLARDCGARAQVITAVTDLTPAMLSGVTVIGLAESTSAPTALAGEVTAALSGLGPLSVVRRQVSSADHRRPAGAGPARGRPAGRGAAGRRPARGGPARGQPAPGGPARSRSARRGPSLTRPRRPGGGRRRAGR